MSGAKPARLANRTIWALEDIMAAAANASEHWVTLFDRAAQSMPPAAVLALAALRDDLARIDRAARDGRYGSLEGDR